MNWGNVKLAALQTMFANEGMTLTADDSNQEYINAMPGKANEAMLKICMTGRPLLKRFEIEISADAAEEVKTDTKMTLPNAGGLYSISLTESVPRFKALDRGSMMLLAGGIYDAAEDWKIEGDDQLLLSGETVGTYSFWYEAYPQKITTSTEDTEKIDMPEECAALIPIYIAAELYKEDDLSMATMFWNEFEDGLMKVKMSYQASGAGVRTSARRNTTGWW